jgi:hypothetical protein
VDGQLFLVSGPGHASVFVSTGAYLASRTNSQGALREDAVRALANSI